MDQVEALALAPQDLSALAALAKLIKVDPETQDVTLQNGESRIILQRDGVIRIEGARIVQIAERDLAFKAATIDLN